MTDEQKNLISKLVLLFAKKARIDNPNEIINTTNRLCSMSIEDSIDSILISLNDLLHRKLINQDDIFENIDLLLALNPLKYSSINSLIDRLNWIQGMNMECPNMSLIQNHQLILEAFDCFNELMNNDFDCYYTGGIMAYLAINRKLERYHEDLDLFINEQQLLKLKELVDFSEIFHFVSNMSHKEVKGHEYKIVYKDTPISIGLFLFERQLDNSITTKNYYFENDLVFVDEHHFSKKYTEMSFLINKRQHNGLFYKMVSLEIIYNLKKNGRPKDRHDAQIIKDNIDMSIDYRLDTERKNNFNINHKIVYPSIINNIEPLINEQKKHL